MATLTEEKLAVEHKPFVPDSANLKEFTWSAVIVGSLLGIVFGASSLYLVLKVGMDGVGLHSGRGVVDYAQFRVLAKLPFILPRHHP